MMVFRCHIPNYCRLLVEVHLSKKGRMPGIRTVIWVLSAATLLSHKVRFPIGVECP